MRILLVLLTLSTIAIPILEVNADAVEVAYERISRRKAYKVCGNLVMLKISETKDGIKCVSKTYCYHTPGMTKREMEEVLNTKTKRDLIKIGKQHKCSRMEKWGYKDYLEEMRGY